VPGNPRGTNRGFLGAQRDLMGMLIRQAQTIADRALDRLVQRDEWIDFNTPLADDKRLGHPPIDVDRAFSVGAGEVGHIIAPVDAGILEDGGNDFLKNRIGDERVLLRLANLFEKCYFAVLGCAHDHIVNERGPGGQNPSNAVRVELDMNGANPPAIRAARPQDAEAIAEIEQLSFVHAGERFGPRKVQQILRNRRYFSDVVEVEGKIAGWCVSFLWKRSRTPWGRIYGLAVSPHFQGRKFGQLLLTHAIERLGEKGMKTIVLEVRTDNVAAIKLYKKFGFAHCRNIEDFYGAGIHASRMILNVSR